jgi:hypothetical protein
VYIRTLVAAAGSVLFATPILGQTKVYDFTFNGTGHADYVSQCCTPFGCMCVYDFPFYGTVRVETSGSGDGIFSGSDLVAVSLTWKDGLGPLVTIVQAGAQDPFARQYFPTATVLNGEVVDIQASYQYGHGAVSVDDMIFHYSQRYTAIGGEQASAPLIPAIPEPSSALLLLGGLIGGLPMARVARSMAFQLRH